MKENQDILMTKLEDDSIMEHIDPKEIRALFNLFNGKPNSTTRIFPKNVLINMDDIFLLRDKMNEKLNHYDITALICTIGVQFEKDTGKDFTSWEEFEDYNWSNSLKIESMILKWDFMIKFKNYGIPQRHTVIVRLSAGMKPEQLLQMILSGNIEDVDRIDKNIAPTMCVVSFVDHLLSDEIINIVEEWNKGLKSARAINNKFKFIKKNSVKLTKFIRGFTQFMGGLTAISIFNKSLYSILPSNISNLSVKHLQNVVFISFFAYIFYILLKELGVKLGKLFIQNIDEYGDIHTFDITKGDKSELANLENKNKNNSKHIISSLILSISLNVFCGILSSYLFMLFNKQ